MRRKDREMNEPQTILRIIRAADSCRLALIDGSGPLARPYLVALNFGFEAPADFGPGQWGRFWFHSAPAGRKIELLRANPQVCLQLDTNHELRTGPQACNWGFSFSSVIAEGQVQFADSVERKRHGLNCLMNHYDQLYGRPMPIPLAPDGSIAFGEKDLAVTTVFFLEVQELSAKVRP